LWSLSNEFWYYVLFPLLFVAWQHTSRLPVRITALVGSMTLLVWLPFEYLMYGLVWLLGYAVYIVAPRRPCRLAEPALSLGIAFAIFGGSVVLARLNIGGNAKELIVAVSFAVLMVPLLRLKVKNRFVITISRELAGFSYTLYLCHFPLVAFIGAYFLEGRRYQPGAHGLVIFGASLVLTLIYAYVLFGLFERRTSAVQNMLCELARRKVHA